MKDSTSTRTATNWPVVVSIHGIRTTGRWQKELTDELVQRGFRHIPLDYGYFPAISLLLPWSRRRKVRWLLEYYDRELSDLAEPPSVVAHSYGTYLLAEAMLANSLMRFDRIILCGSIVRPDYPWSTVLVDRNQARMVLHETGGRDFWAKVVAWAVSDAGSSGVGGFQDRARLPGESGELLVQEIHHPTHQHSDFFFRQNYRERWIPFLLGNSPRDEVPARGRRSNWRFGLTATGLMGLSLAAAMWVLGNHGGQDLAPDATGGTASFTETSQRGAPEAKPPPQGVEDDAGVRDPVAPAPPLQAGEDHRGTSEPMVPEAASVRVTANRDCSLEPGAGVPAAQLRKDQPSLLKVDPGARILTCEDDEGLFSAVAEIEVSPGRVQDVQLELVPSRDSLIARHELQALIGNWSATWKEGSSPFYPCKLTMSFESRLELERYDYETGSLVGSWQSVAPIVATLSGPEPTNPFELELRSSNRELCKDLSMRGLSLGSSAPFESEGTARIYYTESDGYWLELTISECLAHDGEECGSSYFGAEVETLYIWSKLPRNHSNVVEVVSKDLFKVGDLKFRRQ